MNMILAIVAYVRINLIAVLNVIPSYLKALLVKENEGA
jgi:hypothetical protein